MLTEPIDLVSSAICGGARGIAVFAIESAGSSPLPRGDRMLATEVGVFIGTIGGGLTEGRAQERCRAMLKLPHKERKCFVMECDLRGASAAAEGVLCGGKVTLFFEPVTAETAAAYREIFLIRESRSPGAEVVHVECGHHLCARRLLCERTDSGHLRLVLPTGKAADEEWGMKETERIALEAAVEQQISRHRAGVVKLRVGGEEMRIFVGVLFPRPTVYIFGGGHCAQALGQIIPLAGFRYVVLDDRPEFLTADLFPSADACILADFAKPFEKVPAALDGADLAFIVILTRGHLCDKEVLEVAVRGNAKYIGMIGSARKVQMAYDLLRSEGVSNEALARVHAPIGLSIGGSTPGEIAVSITAEMIQVHNSS